MTLLRSTHAVPVAWGTIGVGFRARAQRPFRRPGGIHRSGRSGCAAYWWLNALNRAPKEVGVRPRQSELNYGSLYCVLSYGLALTGASRCQLTQQPPSASEKGAGRRQRAMNPADAARKVPRGIPSGWKGKVDAAEADRGSVLTTRS